MEVVVVFSYDEEGGYYIEGILKNLEEAEQEWSIEKIINGNAHNSWKELQQELRRPTIRNEHQLAYIQKVEQSTQKEE